VSGQGEMIVCVHRGLNRLTRAQHMLAEWGLCWGGGWEAVPRSAICLCVLLWVLKTL
jgi:hypothetical protein